MNDKKKVMAAAVVGSKIPQVKPEMPESVKVMMTQKMDFPPSKKMKLSIKKKK